MSNSTRKTPGNTETGAAIDETKSADEQEFAAFFTQVFRAFLRRPPLPEDIAENLERSRKGLSDREIVSEIVSSAEYRERVATLSEVGDFGEFFATVHEAFLGRKPDAEAIAMYQERCRAGLSERDVVKELAASEEYRSKMADRKNEDAFRTYYNIVYRAFLGRDADEEALSYFYERLCNGMSYKEIAEELARSDEYAEICRHRLFVQPGHYYSAITNADEVEAALSKLENAPMPESLPGLDIDRSAMIALWDQMLPHMQSMPFPVEKSDEFRYHTGNPNFVYGDGVVWHGLLRHLKPKRVVEIGSGFSSANLVDTNERYLDGAIDLTFVEPYPDLLLSLLGPAAEGMKIHPKSVQTVDRSVFSQLEAGDILFIDSTHVLRTGSDVQYELFEVLPMLAEGVVVHIHDIFWPFEYPRVWAVDENRSWNELYGVRAFLTDNPNWEILMFGDYLAKTAQSHVQATLPRYLDTSGGSLYLRKKIR